MSVLQDAMSGNEVSFSALDGISEILPAGMCLLRKLKDTQKNCMAT